MSDEPIRKVSHVIPISVEMMSDVEETQRAVHEALRAALRPVSPEEAAEHRRRQEERSAAILAAAEARHAAARTRLAEDYGIRLVRVLDLHAPHLPYGLTLRCAGCEFDGMEAEPPEWPCATWIIAAGEDE